MPKTLKKNSINNRNELLMTGWWMCRYYMALMELVLQGLFLCPLITEELKIVHYWRFRNSVDSSVFILVLFFFYQLPKQWWIHQMKMICLFGGGCFEAVILPSAPTRPLLHELADVPRALFCMVIIHAVQKRTSILSSLEDKCNINTTSVWGW